MWAITPLGCIMGIILGDSIKNLSFLGTYLFAILTFTGAVSMQTEDFLHIAKHPKPIFTYLIFGRVLICLAASFIVKLLLPNNMNYYLGFLLYIMGPVAVVSFTWTSIFKGNGTLSLAITMVDALISPFFLPFATKVLVGTSVKIDSFSIVKSLIFMVVIPLIIGIKVNDFSKNVIKTKYAFYFKPIGRLALFLALILNCSKISNQAKLLTFKDLYLVLICILVPAIDLILGFLCGKLMHLEAPECTTITFSSGLKNNTASLIIATTYFNSQAALPIMIIIFFQQQIGAIIGQLLFKHKEKA